MARRARRAWFLPLFFVALSATAQTIPIDVEIGYRWLDLKGNEDMYRTQVNEDSGLLLRSFNLSTVDFNGSTSLIDYFRVDASDLGAGPAGSLRLESGKTGLHRFTLRYRSADAFSALPAFANPVLGSGITPGQHTYDRTRNMVDADFEILRWSVFKPFIGYSWNRYDGPGTTTYHVGQDEFHLRQDLEDTDREIRVGTGFEYGPVYGQITQGWRSFEGNETLTLVPGANGGNNSDPVLGHPISIGDFTRHDKTNVDTPFTSFYVSGQATPRVRLIGDYARFTADSDGTETESLSGSFASFALSRFFNGITETASSRAKNKTWRGGARAEVKLIEGVDLLAGWQRDHRELEGSTLIDTLFLQSITFGGADPRDVRVILDANSSYDQDEDVISAAVSAHALGPFSLRAGISRSSQDVTVRPDLSELVVDSISGQGGTFTRKVNTVDLGGTYSKSSLSFGAAWKHDSADDPILRTDFTDRDRVRLRAAWKAPRFFRAGIMAEEVRQDNNRTDINYDAKTRQYTGDVEVVPITALTLRASASRFRGDSSILYRHPENFTLDTSVHEERGNSVEGGLALALTRFTFDGDLTRFDNKGSLPFKLNRSRARVTFQLRENTGLAAEWTKDEYSERNASYADYDATRYGVYLRLRR
jgi:hypothetical protein